MGNLRNRPGKQLREHGVSQRVNYDSVARVYDAGPHREKAFDSALREFLAERRYARPVCILDVACGTGAQLAANRRERPDLVCAGVDASMEMLRVARARDPRIHWLRGDATALPFPDASFDYVSNQFALHHIDRKREFLGEVARVLRVGGRFTIRNLDPWSMPGWIFYHYFPEAQDRDFRDFIPVEELGEVLKSVGLTNVRVDRRLRTDPVKLGEFAKDARRRHGRSQLLALPDSAYELGLARVEIDLARMGSEALLASEKCDVTLTGDRV